MEILLPENLDRADVVVAVVADNLDALSQYAKPHTGKEKSSHQSEGCQ
ncbi:MAG: hypothetical protein IIW69_08150 [Bacteroidaceae bacterium]|nr:hypothetical protein [Bacteroidaceae bacterium]